MLGINEDTGGHDVRDGHDVTADLKPVLRFREPPESDSPSKSVSVVVPVFNESQSLVEMAVQTRAALLKTGRTFEIIFVDDGSTDDSLEIFESLVDDHSCIRVILLAQNFGQTAAIKAGIDLASGDYVVTLDGDLQNDPADIPEMLGHLDRGQDIVLGWRKNRHDDWPRKQASKIANRLIRGVTGAVTNDIGCTLKAMTRSVAQRLCLSGDMHRFIPVLADRLGARSCEIVVNHRRRTHGVTHYGFERVARVLQDIVTLMALKHQSNPMRFFGAWALSSLLISTVTGVVATACTIAAVPFWASGMFAMCSLMTGITSSQLLGLGVLAELNYRNQRGGNRQPSYRVRETLGDCEQPGQTPGDVDSESTTRLSIYNPGTRAA